MYFLPNISAPLEFPNSFVTTPEGLLAIGGNLHPKTLIAAYSKGIFPWYNREDPILWWHPNPRLVLFPEKVHITHKMAKLIRQDHYRITLNQNFPGVISACANKRGPKRNDTWLMPELIVSYSRLHEMGFAHSVEVWNTNNELVGGVYGIALGKIFFGESMFSHEPNTSKLGFIALCKLLVQNHFLVIDCQVETEHMKSLGAESIPRRQFLTLLKRGETQNRLPASLRWTS